MCMRFIFLFFLMRLPLGAWTCSQKKLSKHMPSWSVREFSYSCACRGHILSSGYCIFGVSHSFPRVLVNLCCIHVYWGEKKRKRKLPSNPYLETLDSSTWCLKAAAANKAALLMHKWVMLYMQVSVYWYQQYNCIGSLRYFMQESEDMLLQKLSIYSIIFLNA